MRLLALAAALAAVTSPLRVEHERSREARERIAAKEPERALEAYRSLEAEVGAKPEIEVGRGAALLGAGRHAEAAEAFARAKGAPEPLGSRALLGLGASLAGQEELDGAAAAYREALGRDPEYAEARHDLEVVLRRKAEKPPPPKPQQQQGRQEQPQSGQQPPQGGPEPRPRQEPGQEEPGQQQSGEKKPGEPPAQADRTGDARRGESPAPGERLSRDEAIRLLDAMRARERNLPEAARKRTTRRSDADKDW